PVIFDLVSSLVDKSLVVRYDAGDAVARFGMLETIREYALEQLEASGETEAARAAHAHFFLQLAEQAEIELRGRGQVAWLNRLDVDHINLRAALTWCLAERQETEAGPRLAGALGQFWFRKNSFNEGRHWLDQALSAPGLRSPEIRAKVLVSDGALTR